MLVMPQVRITLPSDLTSRHRQVVLKYFERSDRLRADEWKLALDSFDLLGKSIVVFRGRRLTFRQLYDRLIDRKLADDFIEKLLALADLERRADALREERSGAMLQLLEHEGLYGEEVADSEYFAAYCLYWWTAFMRGYVFEVAIYRDLRAAGVDFAAHDLRKPRERRSPYDLVVLRQLGDIKTTTYFLHAARTRVLHCDFYLTRLYQPRQRR